ncbi:TetR/AcrR family transcriptional regulator [Nocardia yamanashiensis]|uniref:TetR/AcrR family transcriptional regulator n=1 Tax=Nocardia yamanashiensis TaxID=209247 RepID=UPI00082AE478|nr:TetR family transcriptional regulator [Nocardia yamanashiensis]
MSAQHAPGTQRAAAAARTRDMLIDTGFHLAETTPLKKLSANVVVAAAGVSKGTFFHHFPTRADYLVALHDSFHDLLEREILTAVAAMAPAADRLITGSHTYLDVCLRNRGVRALLAEARAEPDVAASVQARSERTAELCVTDFRVLGATHPRESARLWVRLVAEVALQEVTAGGPDPSLRAALGEFVRRP